MNPNFLSTILANAIPQILHGFLMFWVTVLSNPYAFWTLFAFVALGIVRFVMPRARRRRRRA